MMDFLSGLLTLLVIIWLANKVNNDDGDDQDPDYDGVTHYHDDV